MSSTRQRYAVHRRREWKLLPKDLDEAAPMQQVTVRAALLVDRRRGRPIATAPLRRRETGPRGTLGLDRGGS